MTRKILTIVFMCIVVSFGMLCTSAEEVASGACGDNLIWVLDDKGTLTISGEGEMYNWESYDFGILQAPWYDYGYNSIKKVVINNGVTTIGNYAFSDCYEIEKIEIPDSVTKIGYAAIDSCYKLKYIYISEFVTDIGIYLQTPGSASLMSGWYGSGIFDSCYSLSCIFVNANNPYYSSDENGILFNKDKSTLIHFPNACNLEEYRVPEGVTELTEFSFSVGGTNSKLKSVILPHTLTEICNDAFRFSQIENVHIPDSITKICLDAFMYCEDLKSIEIPNSVIEIEASAFYGSGLTSIEIPNSVSTLADSVFAQCGNLVYCKLPENISEIPNGLFTACYSLKEIEMPENITVIGDDAFWNCRSLTSITISDSVTSIGNNAFKYCDNLTIRGNKGSTAQTYATENGIMFELLPIVSGTYGPNVTWTLDVEGTLTFRGTGKVCYTEGGTLPDSSFVIKKIVFDEGITGVEEHTFRGMQNLESIIMADSVVNIGYSAFRWCPSLTDIKFSKNLKTIQPFVFADCTSLTAVDIPEGVKCITDGAFSGCTNLENVSIPDSVEYIVGRTFADCTKLEIIDLPKNFKVIYSQAFDNTAFYNNESNWNNGYLCYKNILFAVDDEYTGDFVVEDSIEYIALNAFDSYDYDITGKIIISENNKKYSSDTDGYLYSKDKKTVFECFYIWGTESISVPDGVEKIGAHSFDSVRAQSIILPKTVKTIEDGAFHGCSFMTEINIPNGVTSIGVDVFNRCYALEEITIPASVTHIGTDAFFWCGGSYESNFKIYGIPGSYAETYASENNIPFEEMPLAPGDINGTGKPDDQDVANLAGFIVSNDISSLSKKQLAAANLYTADDGENGEPVINIKDLIKLAQMMTQNK